MKKRRKLRILPVLLSIFTLLLVVVALVIIISSREVPLPVEYSEIVEAVSFEEGVPENVLYAVIYTESSFVSDAVSVAGAVGLMQMLPETAEWLCSREGVEFDKEMLTNPEFSIKYGAKYLKILYDRYENWDAAHAAYHAGFSRVDSWLEEGTAYYNDDGQLKGIPLTSTDLYVNKIRDLREKYFKQLQEEEA